MSLWERAQLSAAAALEAPAHADAIATRPDPLAALLNDPSITEVIANGPAEIWVERRGRLQRAALRFDDAGALRDACVRLAARAGRRLDDAQPMVDARLADGSRLNVVLPPLAPDGPLLTLRRFAPRPFTLSELVELGSLTEADAGLLERCVRARLSIVISGGTSSGKTSLLGALAACVEASERIVTVEDAAELRIDRPHVARLEARGASLEGTGEVGIRELVRNALRMRPDRLVVGEVRGGEALDMLQAMNTDHGSRQGPRRRAQTHRAPRTHGGARAALRSSARAGGVRLRRRRSGCPPQRRGAAAAFDPWRRAARPCLAAGSLCSGRSALQRRRSTMTVALLACLAALACAASAAGGEAVPAAVLLRFRTARGERALERELPDALRRVAAELGAGRTADRALVAAGNAGGPAGEAFALAARRAAAGEDIATALAAALGERARFAAAAISLQLRAGGDLPALLRSLARRLDERRGVNAEIRALTAQARLSARVVPLLPVAGLAVAALLDAGAVRLLLTTAPGLAIVAVGAVLDLVGLLAIRAIARGIG
jgi:type IV secretory pathway ATPase VirB11/archaellum biosynthesis ATPase/Flp pilus assembly protein TadB